MIKVGAINYFMDEFHAGHYTQRLPVLSGGKVRVTHAYALRDTPPADHKFPVLKRDTLGWCRDMGVTPCAGMEELIDNVDVLMVNCPDYPEFHEQLCQLPLRSGKPTFVDKVFAPTLDAAKRMFNLANRHATPVYSCSALRFVPEIRSAVRADITDVTSVWNADSTHLIHQLEPVACLVDSAISRVMCLPSGPWVQYVLGFADGRFAKLSGYDEFCQIDETLCVCHGEKQEIIRPGEDVFGGFLSELTDFYQTGRVKVSQEDTLNLVSAYETCLLARERPAQWLDVPA